MVSGFGVCVADGSAITLGPLLGGGGGPLLDAAVCVGAFAGGRPFPLLPTALILGLPLDGGGLGGRFVKLCDSCLHGLSAIYSAILPPGSVPVVALISAGCSCSFIMFSLSFSKVINSTPSCLDNRFFRLIGRSLM